MFLAEAIMTFAYVATVLSVVYAKAENKMAGGIIIAFVLLATVSSTAKVAGGCINPAVGVSQ